MMKAEDVTKKVDQIKLMLDEIAGALIELLAKIPPREVLENIDKIIEKAEKYDKLASLISG